MRSRVGRAWLALLMGTFGLASAQGLQPIPKLEARVTDLTGTLTAEQQSALEEKLAAFEARKGAQIVVLLVPTTHPEEIEQYSIRVVEQWRIGRAHVDDGALLIVAKNDRRVRIEVGYGLEGALPDAIANRIIAETIRPLFAQNDFYGGINAGVEQIARVIEGEALPAPDHAWRAGGSRRGSGFLPVLFVAVLVGSSVLRAVLGRPAGAAVTAGITGVLVWFFGGLLVAAILAALAAFVFSLLSGMGGGLMRGGGFGGFGGGMLGGGGFGGGGGFSGGGGGFGGGGASGSW
ncbi:MAG TPA: YgcG family protein [Steroidobacteraceae bacterium]|nr:YgcG family protein [Steroidobacteraceae bacterium]